MAADLAVRSNVRSFDAMSCAASAVVVADEPDQLLDYVARRLSELEHRWSRFLGHSELSGLNAAGGSPRLASDDTIRLVEALVQAWHATDGAFDPTLLGTLVGLGYAASRSDATMRTSLAAGIGPIGRPGLVLVDHTTGVVQLPHGTTLDPGGMGKGLAADLIVQELLDLGAHGALVEIGGDLRVAGFAPESDGWPIAIRAANGGPSTRIALLAGGVATSSSRRRTWRVDGEARHHLLDPRALGPTVNDVVDCTVIAGTAAWAEAFTKVAFVRGRAEAMVTYERHGLASQITTADGTVHRSGAWEKFDR
jgi:FAD:protein FMN transferase